MDPTVPPHSPVSGVQLMRIRMFLLCSPWSSAEADLKSLRVVCFFVFSVVCVCFDFASPGYVLKHVNIQKEQCG